MAMLSFDHNEIKGLVSVVIPTYRGERFIGEALGSVSCQTYLDWEIIVVEDGSCGASQEIVAKFAQRHPSKRISYRRNEHNLGPSHARNAAFSRVRGEFVALLDSDDRWLPDHLAISLQALQAFKSDIAYSTVLMIEDQTDLLVGVWGPQRQDLADFPYGLLRNNFITPSATVLRRAVLVEVGAWDTELRFCEDLDFWLRCVAAGKKFQHVTGWHCLYRKNHLEAATRKTCAVLEAFAHVVERYMRLPGLGEKMGSKYAYNAYLRAAEFHAQSDPMRDSSVDPSRIGGLMLHAWRLRPKHVECLWRGTVQSALNLFRRRNPPSTCPANKSELRAAA
jgi:glycosyltransferase involved in cell wall biosynthesis